MHEITVQDAWDQNRGWKWELFSEFLSKDTFKTIAAVEVQQCDDSKDQIVWDSSRNRDFSIKSPILLIRPAGGIEKDQVWSCIWKLQAPQRIKFFLWLVAHERLMMNAHGVRRGLDSDPSCKVCNCMEEDIRHILRDCPTAREVWSHLIPYNSINFYTLPTRSWLVVNLKPCLMIIKV